MAAPVVAARVAVLLADKKNWKWLAVLAVLLVLILLTLIMLPIMIITAILAMLNPTGDELQNDPYYQAIAQVRAEYDIQNDLPVYVAKSVDLIYSGDLLQNKAAAVPFILQHFVDSYERIAASDSGETTDGEETETVYFFRTATEMLGVIRGAPYNFSEADIKAIGDIYLMAEGMGGLDGFTGKLPMPVMGNLTSGYGNRIDPLNGKYFMHPAIDIVPVWHSPVSSVADGTVAAVVTDAVYGNNVTIHHTIGGKEFWSFSAHLSRVDVSVGQFVTQGQTIGLEGGDQTSDPNPGRTTGHHLHFEIWETGTRSGHVNPALYLDG